MQATGEDALNLIRHWKNEDAPLRCTCASEGLGFHMTGRVAELSDSSLSITGTACEAREPLDISRRLGPGRRPSSAAGQDRRAADGDRVAVREGGPVGGRRPFGPAEVDAMSGAQSISTRRAYGVQRVCRVWHRARSSVYARRQATRSPALCRRRGPIGAAPDDVLVAHLRRVLEASPFHGEGYRKAWAKLRVAGVRTSKERVRRLMREHDLQAPPRAGHAHGPKAHDGTITTEAPDVMWGTDMTATVTVAEGTAFVFVAEAFEPVFEPVAKPLDVALVLEAGQKVIGETEVVRLAATPRAHPTAEPQVQHVVQVDVRQQRRQHGPLRGPLLSRLD